MPSPEVTQIYNGTPIIYANIESSPVLTPITLEKPFTPRYKTLKTEFLLSSPIATEAIAYLESTEEKYKTGSLEHAARQALENALVSLSEGNYGIGATLQVIQGKTVYEFDGFNRMKSGTRKERLNGHAETDALYAWVDFLENNRQPDRVFTLPDNQQEYFPDYVVLRMAGTLEPCIKCDPELTHAATIANEEYDGASRVLSISTNADHVSALALLSEHKPIVWKTIQDTTSDNIHGHPNVTFELLKTDDKQLQDISARLFLETREKVDLYLTHGKRHKKRR